MSLNVWKTHPTSTLFQCTLNSSTANQEPVCPLPELSMIAIDIEALACLTRQCSSLAITSNRPQKSTVSLHSLYFHTSHMGAIEGWVNFADNPLALQLTNYIMGGIQGLLVGLILLLVHCCGSNRHLMSYNLMNPSTDGLLRAQARWTTVSFLLFPGQLYQVATSIILCPWNTVFWASLFQGFMGPLGQLQWAVCATYTQFDSLWLTANSNAFQCIFYQKYRCVQLRYDLMASGSTEHQYLWVWCARPLDPQSPVNQTVPFLHLARGKAPLILIRTGHFLHKLFGVSEARSALLLIGRNRKENLGENAKQCGSS